jgi:hypothetical protein
MIQVVPVEEMTPEERALADFIKAFCRGAIYGHGVALENARVQP